MAKKKSKEMLETCVLCLEDGELVSCGVCGRRVCKKCGYRCPGCYAHVCMVCMEKARMIYIK